MSSGVNHHVISDRLRGVPEALRTQPAREADTIEGNRSKPPAWPTGREAPTCSGAGVGGMIPGYLKMPERSAGIHCAGSSYEEQVKPPPGVPLLGPAGTLSRLPGLTRTGSRSGWGEEKPAEEPGWVGKRSG